MRSLIVAAAVTASICMAAQANTYTWNVAGDGDWKTATNWDPATGWPSGSGDTAVLTGGHTVTYEQASGSSTLAALITGTGNVVLDGAGTVVLSNTGNDFSGSLDVAVGILDIRDDSNPELYFGDPNNPVTFRNGVRVDFRQGTTWNPPSTRVITVGAGGMDARLSSHSTTIDDADQLQGAGSVTLTHAHSVYGGTWNVSAAQPNFNGGFHVVGSSRRNAILSPSVADAMGSGAATVTGYAYISPVWGAQIPIGGVTAGILAAVDGNDRGGVIRLTGTGTPTSPDRYTIQAGASIGGSDVQLGNVSRVTEFSASPIGPEAILESDAIVLHTADSTDSIANAGTASDLWFALDRNFDTAARTWTVGVSTPWKGFSNTTVNDQGTSSRSFRIGRGTVNITAGTQALWFQGYGRDYSNNDVPLNIGNGANSPTFTALGDTVPARIKRVVWLDSSAPDYDGGISRWVADRSDGAVLISRRANGFGGLPVDLDNGGYVQQYNAASTIPELTYEGGARVVINRNNTDTSLTVTQLTPKATGMLIVAAGAGRANLGNTERFFVTGFPVGKVVSAPIIANNTDLQFPELATYDAGTGFAVATYDTTDINSADQGDFVKIIGGSAQTLTSDRAMLGLVTERLIAGSGTTISLGVQADSSQAPFAFLLGKRYDVESNSEVRVDPDVDFGSSAGVLYYQRVRSNSHRFEMYGALRGSNGLTIHGGNDSSRAVRIRHAANAITGTVTLTAGHTEITSGNGFEDASLTVMRPAQFWQNIAAQSLDGLRGTGRIHLGASRTLTVNGDFAPGDPVSSEALRFETVGTLALTGTAVLACELDGLAADKSSPRAVLGDTDLTIAAGARIRVDAVANVEALIGQPFVLLTAGSITGEFESVETPPGSGLMGSVTIDTAGPVHTLSVTLQPPPGSLFILR